ncbi:MAG TPA: phosphoribosylformylglycinamidine synthase subunit PurL [Chloroflexota bacterium]|nr:phosphoribosylformylglycinamidine synthase subunit PurL [Chloroflexota bacterium]
MQQTAEDQQIGADLCVEIRPHWPQSLAADDLTRLSLDLAGISRLIDIMLPPDADRADLLRALPVLTDPLVEEWTVSDSVPGSPLVSLDVFPHPGVTDREGETAARALSLASPQLEGVSCRAGKRYHFAGAVPDAVRPSVERLVGNPLIHRFIWSDVVAAQPPAEQGQRIPTQTIPLPEREDELMRMSREHGLALDLAEMQAIATHFAALGRRPTDVELQSIAQTWSEHCSHKTFKADIEMAVSGRRETIHGLLSGYIMAPTAALAKPWVRSAFTDNAGVIAFDDEHDLAFKVETHNHPSALEPFGGAHTGVGGVIRDVLAVSAEPIANTDVLCFGLPETPEAAVPDGIHHPAVMCREVVHGIADYGNNMGIPTVGGAILFHPGYLSNPLVYCGTLGIAPRDSHPTSPELGDAVVVLGGRTGRDGLHGATMSSGTLDRAAVEGTVVQIGDPIVEKTLRDVLPHLRDERLYHAITDCGAGGLCSAVGEMGQRIGVEVFLDRVPLKYPGLSAWEVWLSEAQERIVLAVPRVALPRLQALCRLYDVEATVIGTFRDGGRLLLRDGAETVGDLAMSFLHAPPRRTLAASWEPPAAVPYKAGTPDDATTALLSLLRHPSIASKEEVIRRYDHEVGGGTIVKPLAGDAGPSDGAVLKPLPYSRRGVAVAHGINPLYGEIDPHAMALLAVDEALRNIVAVGGDPDYTALLDNFCWGDVSDSAELGRLVRAAQGCRDAALAYGVPFISGKDSLYNSSTHGATVVSIPGTLLISAVSVVPDVRRAVSMDLKQAGNVIYLLGLSADELGGSHYLWTQGNSGGRVPRVRPAETVPLLRRLAAAMCDGLVRSCHDLSEGGLAVAAAEMAIAGRLGLRLDLDRMPAADPLAAEALLFAESSGRFLVEVAPEDAARFESLLGDVPHAAVGAVTADPRLMIERAGAPVLDLPIAAAAAAWRRL